MKEILVYQKLHRLYLEITGDLESCRNRAKYFLNYFGDQSRPIIFTSVLILLLLIFLRSTNLENFILNTSRISIAVFISFLIYGFSYKFCFLREKSSSYKFVISKKRFLSDIVKKLYKTDTSKYDGSCIQTQLLLITVFNACEHKRHANRNFIEVIILLLILYLIFPILLFPNILLFFGIYIYLRFFTSESYEYVFKDLYQLAFLIDKFNKESPEECKKFILKHKLKEIRELRVLYKVILQIQS